MTFIKLQLGLFRLFYYHYVMLTLSCNRILMIDSQISNPFHGCCLHFQPVMLFSLLKKLMTEALIQTIVGFFVKGSQISRGTHICYIQGVTVGHCMASGVFRLICKHLP